MTIRYIKSDVEISGTINGLDISTITNAIIREEVDANYNLTDSDIAGNLIIERNNALANTVTIPSGLTGTEIITIIQTGAGQVSFVASGGVTINSFNGYLNIVGQYASATLVPNGSDVYTLIGNLSS